MHARETRRRRKLRPFSQEEIVTYQGSMKIMLSQNNKNGFIRETNFKENALSTATHLTLIPQQASGPHGTNEF
ncbi:hypothetical protein ACSBR2_016821 [Camellia fascicularis]